MSVDAIGAMRSVTKTRDLAPGELPMLLRRTRAGFHRADAGMAAVGNDIVTDHVPSEPWRLRDCLEVLAPFDVTLVAVRCPPVELARRERARGDRTPGTAAAQFEVVHAHGDHDIWAARLWLARVVGEGHPSRSRDLDGADRHRRVTGADLSRAGQDGHPRHLVLIHLAVAAVLVPVLRLDSGTRKARSL